MPLLPALGAIIGIGLKCTNERDPALSPPLDWECSNMLRRQQIVDWGTQYRELPDVIRKDLERFDVKLWKQLDDYSKYCPSTKRSAARFTDDNVRWIYSHFTAPAVVEITNIMCRQQQLECKREWREDKRAQNRCMMHKCNRIHPLYGVILYGLDKMHEGCHQIGVRKRRRRRKSE